ncbi:MAG: hypothetical protein FWF91_08730 [Coriobacteriia bacterium]|nr:hypothetical protein [Coriobacteriia bacterium]
MSGKMISSVRLSLLRIFGKGNLILPIKTAFSLALSLVEQGSQDSLGACGNIGQVHFLGLLSRLLYYSALASSCWVGAK